jgi:hypothetical protein
MLLLPIIHNSYPPRIESRAENDEELYTSLPI